MTSPYISSRRSHGKSGWMTLLALALAAGCGDSGGGGGGTGANTAPTVRSTSPANLVTNVARNTQIAAAFSEAMSAASITTTTFTLTDGVTPVPGVVSYSPSGTTALFAPGSALVASTLYTATLTTGVKDAAGKAMAATYTWSFTTGAVVDAGAPAVTSTDPAHLDGAVATNAPVHATFGEAMDPATINTTTFVVTGPGATPVPGNVAFDFASNTATFTPSSAFAASTTFTAAITTGASDLAGNALASNHEWTFTTGTTAAAGPAPVLLRTAGNYVILAKSGISTTGVTSIVGNLGLSPAAAAAITGFALSVDASGQFSTSSLVTGQIRAADYSPPTPSVLTTAVLDMQTAYTDAAGRTLPDFTELGAGNIGGLVLAPGLYKWGTGVSIPTSVTLAGGANDVWIFQIAINLQVANGVVVVLSGGAQAKNIFWQVAGQVALGTTSDFKGILLCQTLIAANTSAVITGRAFAQTAVTLIATTVTAP